MSDTGREGGGGGQVELAQGKEYPVCQTHQGSW